MKDFVFALRDIARATDERTIITAGLPFSAVGDTATMVGFHRHSAILWTLMAANLNSVPLDWVARIIIPGVHASTFLIKQLPILPPEKYLDHLPLPRKITYAELIVPRVLELVYVAEDMRSWANALGYEGGTFPWEEERRHQLRSEIDAIYSCMYGLTRGELEWILEADHPGVSFPTLRNKEQQKYGEYRTKRLVLRAYDQLAEYGII